MVAPRRKPERRSRTLWIVAAVLIVLVALGIPIAKLRASNAAVLKQIATARGLLNEARALREAPLNSSIERNELKSRIATRLLKAQAAADMANGAAHSIVDQADAFRIRTEALHEVDLARADEHTLEAKTIVEEVVASIGRYKRQNLTDQQAGKIRRLLTARCLEAIGHAEKALAFEPGNRTAAIERVRAFRLTGDTEATEKALSEALKLYPDDTDLGRLRDLIRGG